MLGSFNPAEYRLRFGVAGCLLICLALALAGELPWLTALLIASPLILAYILTSRTTLPTRKIERAGQAPTLTTRILDAFPAPVLLIDKDSNVTEANKAAKELFGNEIEDKSLTLTLRHPAALDAVTNAIAGDGYFTAEITLSVPVVRRYEGHVMSVSAQESQLVRAALVLLDVTAARNAEEMRADFVANVSHELRSPLTSLSGFIETLRGPAENDPQARQRFLTIMEDEARRMARIIDDLLSLSRVESNEHIRPMGHVALPALLNEIAELLRLQAEKRHVTITIDAAETLPDIRGDMDELIEVFRNLIDNAVKYCRPGTEVSVRCRAIDHIPDVGGQGVQVAVTNFGDPIPREHLPRLTERFYRVDKARSRDVGGTGLGLAIVKHIVNRHRGRLNMTSDATNGTIFTVMLPLHAECQKTL